MLDHGDASCHRETKRQRLSPAEDEQDALQRHVKQEPSVSRPSTPDRLARNAIVKAEPRTPSPQPVSRDIAISTELTPGNIKTLGFDVALSPQRTPGKRPGRGDDSLYTRAFELALDTVLDQESFLFDERELRVFATYRALSYEARYLYVRLFLRKRAAWFRIDRIGYESDISNVPRACALLHACRFADEDQDLSLQELVAQLSLEELKSLAKDYNLKGTTKDKLADALLSMSKSQVGLLTRNGSIGLHTDTSGSLQRKASDVAAKVRTMLGSLIRLSQDTVELFHRLHLVFYRSAEYDEKSLTTLILARISKRNFPVYSVVRKSDVFRSREDLIEYEKALKLKAEVDEIMEFASNQTEQALNRVMQIFEDVYERWQVAVLMEQDAVAASATDTLEKSTQTYYARRFTAPWIWTRLIFKAAAVLAKRHEYAREHELLSTLLAQKVYRLGRRGEWYDRKALIEQHYNPSMHNGGTDRDRRNSKRTALETCIRGLTDKDTHQIHHDVLQRRIVRLERDLRLPAREQHDFSHIQLRKPRQRYVYGVRLDDKLVGKHSVWRGREGDVSVEHLALEAYQEQEGAGWRGFHSENSIATTLFAMLFFDILFLPIPGVFQTAFQTAPLDLATDAFYPARATALNHRLAEIDNGAAARLLRDCDAAHRERRTWCVGLNWDFALADLVQIATCLKGAPLSRMMRLFAEEYGHRVGGVGDLCLWNPDIERCMFVEVKGPGDRLSETQVAWLDQMALAGIEVELCHVVEGDPANNGNPPPLSKGDKPIRLRRAASSNASNASVASDKSWFVKK